MFFIFNYYNLPSAHIIMIAQYLHFLFFAGKDLLWNLVERGPSCTFVVHIREVILSFAMFWMGEGEGVGWGFGACKLYRASKGSVINGLLLFGGVTWPVLTHTARVGGGGEGGKKRG
jgi:hypothetical protein